MYEKIMDEACSLKDGLIKWRRTIHKMPELGLNLPRTSAYVQQELKKMGINYTTLVNGSCVTALIGSGDRCILLRSDMDGLPIVEETGLPFSSENQDMHACGHDLHTASLLGAAKLLKRHEDELPGCVKLLFQPGEEIFAGAKAVISEGVLENPRVDAAFAMHSASVVPCGIVGYGPTPMAAALGFKITLTGKGGHGSNPALCIDPINTGVHIHLALQELIAREVPSAKEAVLTIGEFQAGNAANIIPQTAVLQGTLRTFDNKLHNHITSRIKETVEYISKAYRTEIDFEELYNVPAVENNPDLNDIFVSAVREMNPELKLYPAYHIMSSEDFAFISEKVPSCYFAFGAAVSDKSKLTAHHNSKVLFNEDALPVSAAVYTCAALSWLEEQHNHTNV